MYCGLSRPIFTLPSRQAPAWNQDPLKSVEKNLAIGLPIDPGGSGSPFFNRDGSVIGMIRAAEGLTRGVRVAGTLYAVHVDEIREALPPLKRG